MHPQLEGLSYEIHDADIRLDYTTFFVPWTSSIRRKHTSMTYWLYWLAHDRRRLKEIRWFQTDAAKFLVRGVWLSAPEQLRESLMSLLFLLRCLKKHISTCK